MWIFLLFFGSAVSIPVDEFSVLLPEGEFMVKDNNLLKKIVPAGFSGFSQPMIDENSHFRLSSVFRKENELHRNFNEFVEKGITAKGLIFNVYDDNMRNAAIALFKLLRDTRSHDNSNYCKLTSWLKAHINADMFDYARRLTCLYGPYKLEENFLPPFVANPNYFVNGETIMKAFYVRQNLERMNSNMLSQYQVFYLDPDTIVINTNYSGWNIPLEGCDREIKYFIEDVGLNSYYYGVHLLHPFWMNNAELSELNIRHAEHYYFTHQQLYARYLLEKEHVTASNKEKPVKDNCEPDYFPYLYYKNGMPFPTRSSILGDKIREDLAYLKTIDIAIKECIQRGLVIMENGTFIRVSDDNYIDLMTKLIRANLDSVKASKIIRSIFGYGNNGYPVDKYNPSPSVLHHPQTTLREPVYWFMIHRVLDYFSEYVNSTEPYNIFDYETGDFIITDAEFSPLTTTFDYYLINLLKSLEGDTAKHGPRTTPHIYARQRRLNHLPFTMNFTVVSTKDKDVIVRLYLGPQCSIDNCWDIHYKFFQLDCYRHKLINGTNYIVWDPSKSKKYSTIYVGSRNETDDTLEDNYDIYKFPQNLVLPKGLENGLNLTLFIMILKDNGLVESSNPSLYNKVSYEVDNMPLGFPFHKQAEMYNDGAANYQFYNITVYHLKDSVDKMGYFSPFLY